MTFGTTTQIVKISNFFKNKDGSGRDLEKKSQKSRYIRNG